MSQSQIQNSNWAGALNKNDRRKIDIIETAIPLFAKLGPDGVSLRKVASAAGIKIGTLYYYFPEKYALYQAAVDHALAATSRQMRAATSNADTAIARMQGIIEVIFNIFATGNPIGVLADRELLSATTHEYGVGKLSLETVREFRDSQEVLKSIIAEIGGLPADALELDWLEDFAISSMYGVARLRAWSDQSHPDREPVDANFAAEKLLQTLVATFKGARGAADTTEQSNAESRDVARSKH